MTNEPLMVNSFDPTNAVLDSELSDLIARRSKVLGPSYKLFYDNPVHFVRGKGVRLYDSKGIEYLDVYNNVPSVGHCHPRVVDAQSRQASLLNTHTRYLSEVVLSYAERLTATFPAPLNSAMFTCTGSEANDLAFRIANLHTGNRGIIVTSNGYHGITAAVAAASPSLGRNLPLGNHVRTIAAPNPFKNNLADAESRFEVEVETAIDDLMRHGIRPAAIVFDTIFSSDGIHTHPLGFIAKGVERVREAGGIFIADEVQAGLARTGDAMWGFQRHGITPDIVTLGKPMGNGLPIAGIVADPALLEEFGRTARYFNTFGGNPVCCAAGLAVLDVIDDEKLQDNARKVGSHLLDGLYKLASNDERIGQVRGAGLFIGVDIVKDNKGIIEPDHTTALAIVNRLRDLHVLIGASGTHGQVLKIRPPLPFSVADAEEFLEKAACALNSL